MASGLAYSSDLYCENMPSNFFFKLLWSCKYIFFGNYNYPSFLIKSAFITLFDDSSSSLASATTASEAESASLSSSSSSWKSSKKKGTFQIGWSLNV